MQYAINYSSKKTSHIVFTENICLKKQNKTNKKRISDYSKIGYSFLTPPRCLYKEVKKFFLSIKTRTKWDEIMIVIFQEKKNQKMENIFLCLCMLCINQIFFDPRSGARTSTLLVEK